MDKKSLRHITQVLEKKPACYVLITCGTISDESQMQVEMSYQGDPALVSYLLQGAQHLIDENDHDVSHNNFNSISLVK